MRRSSISSCWITTSDLFKNRETGEDNVVARSEGAGYELFETAANVPCSRRRQRRSGTARTRTSTLNLERAIELLDLGNARFVFFVDSDDQRGRVCCIGVTTATTGSSNPARTVDDADEGHLERSASQARFGRGAEPARDRRRDVRASHLHSPARRRRPAVDLQSGRSTASSSRRSAAPRRRTSSCNERSPTCAGRGLPTHGSP